MWLFRGTPEHRGVLTLWRHRLTDDTDSAKQCTFTWKAGASSLSVNKSSLSLVNGGTGQTVNVTSNDDWNVS